MRRWVWAMVLHLERIAACRPYRLRGVLSVQRAAVLAGHVNEVIAEIRQIEPNNAAFAFANNACVNESPAVLSYLRGRSIESLCDISDGRIFFVHKHCVEKSNIF